MQLLRHVEETHDDVVATCGLTATEHATKLKKNSQHNEGHKAVTYSEGLVGLDELAVGIGSLLEVLHAAADEGREQFIETTSDGVRLLVQRHLLRLNVGQRKRHLRHKLVSVQLVVSEVTIVNAQI